MSSPVIAEREHHPYRVPLSSRLIPGLPFPYAAPAKKKPQSVRNDRYWIDAPEIEEPLRPGLASEMCKAVLPAPATGSELWRVAAEASADFAVASLNLAILLSLFTVRMGGRLRGSSVQLGVIFTFSALLTLLAHSEGLYRSHKRDDEAAVVLGKIVAWATAIVAGLMYESPITLSLIAINAPLTYFSLLAWRRWRFMQSNHADAMRKVLIVGAGVCARDLAQQLADPRSRRMVCGFLDDESRTAAGVLGGLADLAQVARSEFVDEIILTQDAPRDVARRVIREARRNRLDVKIVPDLYGAASHAVALDRFGGTPVLTLREEPIPVLGLLVKRTIDFMLSSVAIVAALPFMAVIAVLIKWDSAGPAVYRAVRVGKKGRRFHCYKFRTMRTNAEELKEQLRKRNEREGAFFKIADDPRITRVGRFLRKYSIDEVPQLLNVWRGEMSLVGPRPHPVDDCERYRLQDLRRLDVMPGLTGLWQVAGRGDPSFENSMALDLKYIEHWSLWNDLKILFRTIAVVVKGSGS